MASDRFFVKTLTLENFRCFEKVKLGPFDAHFNLLVGTNGSGKSSVLLALANLFRQLGAPEVDGPGASLLGESDVRLEYGIGADGVRSERLHAPGLLKASFSFHINDVVGPIFGDDLIGSEYVGLPGVTLNLSALDKEVFRNPVRPGEFVRIGQPPLFGMLPDHALPMIGFFRTSRLFESQRSASDMNATSNLPRKLAFENWLDSGTSSYALREWIKDQTLVALQQDFRERNSGPNLQTTRQLRQLDLIQDAVARAVEGAKSIEYDAERKDIVIEFEDGARKGFSGMSDGQRALIGLVADIARRACLLNAPYLGKRTLLETTGLVLIDELDLHLHPRWQRRVIGDLKRIFPNIQFFATTHSPQIIGEARPEEIVMLTPEGQKRPMGSFGMESNWVLKCVMEAEDRDPVIAARVKALFDTIEDGHLDDAKAMIEALRADLGDYAPDIAGAESYIWRIEHDTDEAAE